MTALLYLMADNQDDAVTALKKINENCGFPNPCAQTWSDLSQAYQQNIWFFVNPPDYGYQSACGLFTRDEMMSGVVNVTESNGDSSWFPPAD